MDQRQGIEIRHRWLRRSFVTALVLLPIALPFAYRFAVAWPERLVLATATPGGRYHALGSALEEEIEQRLGIPVDVVNTEGSWENLRRLRNGAADLGFYEPGTEIVLGPANGPEDVSFVANLYPQVLHVIVRGGGEIRRLEDLRGRKVSMSRRGSGDYALGTVLLDYLGISRAEVEIVFLAYGELADALTSGEIDAGLVSTASEAPALDRLLGAGDAALLEIPFVQALTDRHLHLAPYRIPAATYRRYPEPVPPGDVDTVATGTHLLARRRLPAALVEDLTALLHDPAFLRRQHLGELLRSGTAFSRAGPEQPLHPGAAHFYEPGLKPLLDADFVEALEGLRSFLVSFGLAGFIAYRWYRRRLERNSEHRLDRYIRRLLDIERRQVGLDEGPSPRDTDDLNGLLNEVTVLRQDALREFSAHDLSEDRGVDCFIEMCHALSNKINAKLTRQRLDLAIERLAAPASPPGTAEPGSG